MKKRHIVFGTFKIILKAVWNVLLLVIYGTSKLIEIIAGFLGKLSEKLLTKHN